MLSGLNAVVARCPAQISVLKPILLGCRPVSSKFELKWHIVKISAVWMAMERMHFLSCASPAGWLLAQLVP